MPLRGLGKEGIGNLPGSIEDYSKAIEINPKFAVAYFYRGLAKINLNRKDEGCLDLSKSGELGYKEAYNAIKRFCK